MYQTPKTPNPNRSDHIWHHKPFGWKCLLCGAVVYSRPPEFPTNPEFAPDKYEKLTPDERDLALMTVKPSTEY